MIPTDFDQRLAEIDQHHNATMIRLKTAHWSRPSHENIAAAKQSLDDYSRAVRALIEA